MSAAVTLTEAQIDGIVAHAYFLVDITLTALSGTLDSYMKAVANEADFLEIETLFNRGLIKSAFVVYGESSTAVIRVHLEDVQALRTAFVGRWGASGVVDRLAEDQ